MEQTALREYEYLLLRRFKHTLDAHHKRMQATVGLDPVLNRMIHGPEASTRLGG